MQLEDLKKEAESYFNEKKFQDALDKYLLILNSINNSEDKAHILSSISACYAWLGDFNKSDNYELESIRECNYEPQKNYYEALYLYGHGEYLRAKEIFEKLLHDSSFETDKGNLETFYAFVLDENNEYSAALDYYKKGHSLLDSKKNPTLYAKLLYEYAFVLDELDYIKASDKIYEECESYLFYLTTSALVTFHSLRTRRFLSSKNYKKAIKYADRLNEILNEYDNDIPGDQIDYYILIARAQVGNHNYKKALDFLNKLPKELDDEWDQFEYYENISISLFELNEFKKAKIYLIKLSTHPVSKRVNENREYLHRKMLGITLYELKDYKEAKKVFQELLPFCEKYDISTIDILEYINKFES